LSAVKEKWGNYLPALFALTGILFFFLIVALDDEEHKTIIGVS